jgi:hypothetical protein
MMAKVLNHTEGEGSRAGPFYHSDLRHFEIQLLTLEDGEDPEAQGRVNVSHRISVTVLCEY